MDTGLKVVVKNAKWSARAASWLSPVPEGLQYANFFGGSQKSLGRNLAPGKPAATVVGAPTVNTNSAVFSYLERLIKTGVLQTNDCTLITVAKFPTGTTNVWRQMISNFGRDNGTGGFKWGFSLTFKLDATPPDVRATLGLVPVSTAAVTGLGSAVPAQAGMTICAAARVDSAARVITCDNKTAGTTKASTYLDTLKPELNGEFFIGSAAGARTDSVGDLEVSFAAIFDRVLSDAELATFYQSLKGIYAAKGVAI